MKVPGSGDGCRHGVVTMSLFVFSDLRIITGDRYHHHLGLLFDTLSCASFMTPSIAALLGRWFWWLLRVRPRPASQDASGRSTPRHLRLVAAVRPAPSATGP